MCPAVAARMATVCALVAGIAVARADRRPVVVIDLSGDVATRTLALELGNLLVGHTGLRPIDDQSMIAEVTGPFEDENQVSYKTGDDFRIRAETQLSLYSFGAAYTDAESGQAALHKATPTTQTVTLYADLAFQSARARLGENKDAEATELFTLVHRLSPGRKLDPGRYQQFVIQAFEASRFGVQGTGTLVVKGPGRAWIDGKDRGLSGSPFELEAGWHVVWLTGPERTTVGQRVKVEVGKEAVVEIGDEPADDRTKVRRARLALKFAPDPTARAAAIKRIAKLLKARDAVLVTTANGKLIAQTWHDRVKNEPLELMPGFSAHRIAEPAKPLELLQPLAPPIRPPEEDEGVVIPPIVETPRWYQRRSVQISVAVGVIAVVVGSILIARSLDDSIATDTNPSFDREAKVP